MKELIQFSLKRRFFNGATLILNILLCLFISCACFADKIVELVNPTMFEDQKMYLDIDETIENALIAIEPEGLKFIQTNKKAKEIISENPKAYVLTFDDGYKITSQYKLDDEIVVAVESMLDSVHKTNFMNESLSVEEIVLMNQTCEVENIVLEESVEMDTNKQNVVFMFITSIYFAMISFSTSVANEVVYEKSTRQLELILTSVDAKTHFISKMTVGWLTIIIQVGSAVFYGIIFLLIRNFYDSGKGLIEIVNKLGLIEIKGKTFIEILKSITFDFNFVSKMLFITFFLMMGILLLQMIMVILSSFITSVEEAGNVQAPLYMVLIAVYYFALSINTPYQLSEGFGYIFSFFPFLNMLFMPCRLLIQNVSIFELLLSALVSSFFMFIILTKGVKVYQRGVLDYTNKGLGDILKKTFAISE